MSTLPSAPGAPVIVKSSPKPLSPSRARSGRSSAPDTRLVFLLAQQTIQRWQFLVEGHSATPGREIDPEKQAEIKLGITQLDTMLARIRPLTRSRKLATRFEAEELLRLSTQTLGQLEGLRSSDAVGFNPPRQSAVDVQTRLTAKLRRTRRSKLLST